MKPTFNQYNTPTLCALALVTLALSAVPAVAAPLYWDGTDTTANADGGSGTWDLTTTNWDTAASGGADIAWPNGGNANIANFGGTGGTVTLGTSMGSAGPYPNTINVTAGNYIFDLGGLDLAWRGSGFVVSSGATAVINNGTVTMQSSGALVGVTGANALTINAKITGSFGFQKGGGGEVKLTNDANDFTGVLEGQNGSGVYFSSIANSGVASAAGAGNEVKSGNNNILYYTGAVDSTTDRTLTLNGGGAATLANQGLGNLIWTGPFSNQKTVSNTFTLLGNYDPTRTVNEVHGALADNASFVLSLSANGNDTWKLHGINTFTGNISCANQALLVIDGAGQLGSGSYAGTITLGQGSDFEYSSNANQTLSGNITDDGGGDNSITKSDNGTLNITGNVTVSGGITAAGGTLSLSGVNTYTGTTTIAAGTLQADRADVAATSGALGNGGNISFTGGTLQYTANSAGTNYAARIVSNTSAAIKLDTNGQNVTFGTALSSTNTAGLTKEGAGQLELKMGAGQYTGTTTINGGTLKFAGLADLNGIDSSSININNGASLVIYSDFGRTTLSNSKTFTFGSTGGGSIVYDKGNHLWQSSTGQFVTTGGTQNTISSANGGFINPQNANTVNFDVADGSDAVDLLVSAQISSGNYTKSGAGTLSITSFSTLGGGGVSQPNLTINAGTFDVGGTGRLTTSGQATGVVTSNILNNGVYRHSSSGAQTLSGIMSGTGALTQNGSGTLTISGTNTYTGTTTVSGGTLAITSGSSNSPISVNTGAVLELSVASTITSTASLTLDGGSTVSVTGSPTLGSYTLLTAASINGTPVLAAPVAGYELVKDGNSLKLNSTASGSFTTWATANGIPGEPASGDFDNDGITNLVEYALGKNPTTSSQPAGVLSGNVITFTKGTDAITNGDVSWIIETSGTLALGSWTAQVTQPAGDATATISYTLTPGSPAKNFARLKVIQN